MGCNNALPGPAPFEASVGVNNRGATALAPDRLPSHAVIRTPADAFPNLDRAAKATGGTQPGVRAPALAFRIRLDEVEDLQHVSCKFE